MQSDEELTFMRYTQFGAVQYAEFSRKMRRMQFFNHENLQNRLHELQAASMDCTLTQRILDEWPTTQAIRFSREVMLETQKGKPVQKAIDTVLLRHPGSASRMAFLFPDGSEAVLGLIEGKVHSTSRFRPE